MFNIPLLDIQLTNRCDSHCRICGQAYNRKNKNFIFSDIQLTDIKKAFKNYNLYCDEIYCWGGEPFLHSEIYKLIEFLHDFCSKLSINTNGSSKDKIIDIFKMGLIEELVLSLDGERDINDRIREKGSYDDIVAILNEILIIDPGRIRINITITSENIDSVFSLVKFLSKIGVRYISFQLPVYVNYELGKQYNEILKKYFDSESINWEGFVFPGLMINGEKLFKLFDNIESINGMKFRYFPARSYNKNFYLRYFDNNKDRLINEKVYCGFLDSFAIDAFGNFVLCPDFPDIHYGNIRDNCSFQEIINAKKDIIDMLSIRNKPLGVCYRCCHNIKIIEYEEKAKKRVRIN